MAQAMVWDLFCRVIDNFGDIGVCWRLACDLASRGERVRLRTNDSSALAWMAPQGQPQVELRDWGEAIEAQDCGDVVIEAFGCELPGNFVRRMALRRPRPVWINLEHLSAQGYARRSHGLPSPQLAGPGAGLRKWFFFPGFVPGTGGLIREPGLAARQHDFDAPVWLAAKGLQRHRGERLVSLFCYDASAVAPLLDTLATAPTLLLASTGSATRQVTDALGPSLQCGALRAVSLPLLAQSDFDSLLWSCDLNFVRGEDSWVRAQWAGQPFVWQAYRQTEGAQQAKLAAFLELYLAGAGAHFSSTLRRLYEGWNGRPAERLLLPALAEWRAHTGRWRHALQCAPDLTTQILGFAREKR